VNEAAVYFFPSRINLPSLTPGRAAAPEKSLLMRPRTGLPWTSCGSRQLRRLSGWTRPLAWTGMSGSSSLSLKQRGLRNEISLPDKGGLDTLEIAFKSTLVFLLNELKISHPNKKKSYRYVKNMPGTGSPKENGIATVPLQIIRGCRIFRVCPDY